MDNASFADLLPWFGPALVGLGALLLLGVVLVAGAMVGLRGRRRRGPGDVRAEALGRLGYTPAGPKRWAQPINRTKIVYHELPNGGGKWTVQLTRYNTLNLQVEEKVDPTRSGGGHPFSTQISAIEERFVTSSDRPAQCMALATHPTVVRCMLAMPFLSMSIRGDELVFEDVERRSIRKLLQKDPHPSTARQLAAEAEVHQATLALATVILEALYTRTSGTLFAEHR